MEGTESLPQEIVERFVIAAHGDFARVRELYEANPAVLNEKWVRFDESALEAATQTGNRQITEYLLAQGAPLTIVTAAMLGRTEDVARFLDEDPSLANAKGSHGIPIMFHAAMSGKPEVGELLLAHGGGEGIDVALHGAVNFGHVKMVRWMLDHGVENVNAPNYDGKTPLAVAVEANQAEIAEMLRERGGTE